MSVRDFNISIFFARTAFVARFNSQCLLFNLAMSTKDQIRNRNPYRKQKPETNLIPKLLCVEFRTQRQFRSRAYPKDRMAHSTTHGHASVSTLTSVIIIDMGPWKYLPSETRY